MNTMQYTLTSHLYQMPLSGFEKRKEMVSDTVKVKGLEESFYIKTYNSSAYVWTAVFIYYFEKLSS